MKQLQNEACLGFKPEPAGEGEDEITEPLVAPIFVVHYCLQQKI